MKKKQTTDGFSLIELMVVVAIIGILSAIGVPKYQVFKAKSIQAEAKSSLTHVYTLEQAYFMDNDVYITATASLSSIGWTTPGNAKYAISLANGTTGTTDSFVSTATYPAAKRLASCSTAAGDVWTIDQDKTMNNSTKGLTGCN